MELVFGLWLLLITILTAAYYFSISKFNYWKKKKIPYLQPVPIFGNYRDYMLLNTTIGEMVQTLCQKFKDVPYFGAFYGTEPTLIVQDRELIKLVMTKDFYYFSGREVTKYTHKEVTTKNIFFSGGDHWKVVRQSMTPLFSSAKMKNMFYLIRNCSHEFETMLDKEVSQCDEQDVRTMMVRFSMGCIGSCVFGVDTHTIEDSSKDNIFFKMGNLIFECTTYRGFKTVFRAVWPAIFYGTGFKLVSVSIDSFFSGLLSSVFQTRNHKPSNRNDFIDLILNLKSQKYLTGDSLSNLKDGGDRKVNIEVNEELLIAQCVTLFAGGFETSATTLSFTLFELAKCEEAQNKALAEVDEFLKRHNNKLTYACTSELPYLEACLYEALRFYPVLGVHTREVVDDYTFPSGLQVDKGVRIHIPVHHLHRNPDYFPEPEKFRPERFLPENRQDIKPFTYFAFGEGPRVCIGKRFGKMQVLAGLVTILKKYRVELAADQPAEVKLQPRALVTQPVGAIRLKCVVREGWRDRVFDSTAAE